MASPLSGARKHAAPGLLWSKNRCGTGCSARAAPHHRSRRCASLSAASQAGRLFMVCTTRKARAQLTGAKNFRPPARISCRVEEAALARDDLRLTHFVVIAGLDPAIQLFARVLAKQMDARVKPAHDDST
jgi:hypothetical protein